MKLLRIYLLIFLLLSSFLANAQFDSLFAKTDVVLSGKITSIYGGFSHDLGTEYWYVSIATDSIYKQNFHIETNPTNITWVVSNLRCKETPLEKCISKYQNKKWIFFLNKEHFYGGDELPDSMILPFSHATEESILKVSQKQKIKINHFSRNKKCDENCKLCNHIKNEEWKKVEKYIGKHLNDKNGIGWMEHRRIKWTLTDRVILSSLPSYCSTRFMFITENGETEAYVGYQVGYYKTFCTWIPYLFYELWGLQAFKHFSIENVDKLILKKFLINTNYSVEYLGYEKANDIRMLTDTAKQKIYGENMPLPDDYVLLAAVFDGEIQLYEDYKTMPDYLDRAKAYIDKLESEKKVYLLSLIASHTIPEIAEYSLQALQRLNDERCIPFLIALAEYKSNLFAKGWMNYKLSESFMLNLILTLDSLTDCKTNPQDIPYGFARNVWDLSENIPIWKKKISSK
ncbi:MAG: hypothetical protein K9J13_05575 [Saprospiraceae bacterium]|nr:hypothetical protein [Saprospiraceae bacterium]